LVPLESSLKEVAMFGPIKATATIPAQDIERAKAFYADKLGLTPSDETPNELTYVVGETQFVLFPSSGKSSGDHTQLGFDVEDIHDAVADLRDRGVIFEEYDLPGFKTVDGIAEIEGEKGAWFKDSEGNLLSLGERSD
jgi:catechol 2,3-dioxygenase-like lactoylglutathione lyase family enzyme